MGGVYATTNPEKVMEDRNIDCVVLGEGEYMLPYLVKFYLMGLVLPIILFRSKASIISSGPTAQANQYEN